jgi:hypothetical protein
MWLIIDYLVCFVVAVQVSDVDADEAAARDVAQSSNAPAAQLSFENLKFI